MTLSYHDVLSSQPSEGSSGFPGAGAAVYKVPEQRFADQLRAISAAGHRPVQVGSVPSGGLSVLLTFDDGGHSALTTIAPLLESFGWRGHFFVPTAYLGAPGFLTEEEVRELHRRGHTIGSHSASHPERMSFLSRAQLLSEWQRSCDELSRVIGARVTTASVPNGYYARPVAVTASEAGIRWLFTSEPRVRPWTVAGCTVLGRYAVMSTTTAETVRELVRPWSAVRLWTAAGWTVRKVAKAAVGPLYPTVRSSLLQRRGS